MALAKIPPPRALSPAVLFPLTVLLLSVDIAIGMNPSAIGAIADGAVSADRAVGERDSVSAKIPPPSANRPVVLFPLTVLLVSATLAQAKIPPPRAESPVVLFPLTVLWVSVNCPPGRDPAAVGDNSRGAVSADGALGERRRRPSAKIPPPWRRLPRCCFR